MRDTYDEIAMIVNGLEEGKVRMRRRGGKDINDYCRRMNYHWTEEVIHVLKFPYEK